MSDLFHDPAAEAFNGYAQAFDAWRAAMRAKGDITSPQGWGVYEDMWVAFARLCTRPGRVVALEHLRIEDLERFIRTRGSRAGDLPTPRYVWRLLHLIDRVLTHAALARRATPPTVAMDLLGAHREWRYAQARRHDVIDYLAPAPARRLVAYLSRVRARPGRTAPDVPWQQVRNCTSLALQLGAGLTPGEVRALTLSCAVEFSSHPDAGGRRIHVPAGTHAPARKVPVAHWAAELLRHWLQVRQDLAIPGDWLLPATKTGKPWAKQTQHDAVLAVLEDAGWPPEQVMGGAFRLRHTFALRMLRKGVPEQEVARWLGVEPNAMLRYRGVGMDPVLDLA